MTLKSQLKAQGQFDRPVPMSTIRRMEQLGLVPHGNAEILQRQITTYEDKVLPQLIASYAMPRLLTPTPVSFFEPYRVWSKEKGVMKSTLSMDMEGSRQQAVEYTDEIVALPGFSLGWGESWRIRGVGQRVGVDFDQRKQRTAIRSILRDANTVGLEGTEDGKVKGLIAEVPAANVVAGSNWGDVDTGDPFEDIRKGIKAVTDETPDLEVSGWRLAINLSDRLNAARLTGAEKSNSFLSLVQREFGGLLEIVVTQAMPVGKVLGVPMDPDYADLLTTGTPVIVPIRADNRGVEFEGRLIAIPRAARPEAFFSIDGVDGL